MILNGSVQIASCSTALHGESASVRSQGPGGDLPAEGEDDTIPTTVVP
jgi:hypothetical protein